MHDAHHKPTQREIDELRRMGYETDDIGTRTIIRWAVGLFGFVAASLALTAIVYTWFIRGNNPDAETRMAFPLTMQQRLPPPDAPILQAAPKRDWVNFDATEKAKVSGYNWVDRSKGTVTIPVDRAIDLLAERGLPQRKTPGRAPSAPAPNAPIQGSSGAPGRRTQPPAQASPSDGQGAMTPPTGGAATGGGGAATGGAAGGRAAPGGAPGAAR